MLQNVINTTPYLRTSREWPLQDPRQLSIEVNKSYVDIAAAVNNRVIGLFPTSRPAVTGESWFVKANQKQQILRQVYTFNAIGPGVEFDIPIDIGDFVQFTRIYGTVITTNGSGGQPDYRPLPYVDPGLITTSMTVLVGEVAGVLSIRIVIGATAPPVSSGIVVLEWMSNV